MPEEKLRGARIFVTGGCGFIGSHFVKRCLAAGADVLVLKTPESDCDRLADSQDRIRFARGSITDAAAVRAAIEPFRPQFAVHLAALLNRRAPEDFGDLLTVHVDGTRTLFEALENSPGLERVLTLGTMEECAGNSPPFREDQRETPASPYALTKHIAVKLAEYAGRHGGLPTIVLRPSTVYGPGQAEGMLIPNCIRACLAGKDFPMTSGAQTRDFLFVDDLVDAMVAALSAPLPAGTIIHVGSGKEVAVREVAERINDLCGNPIVIQFGARPLRPGEPKRAFFDISRARQLLPWEPRTPLPDGLAATVRWYQAQAKHRPV